MASIDSNWTLPKPLDFQFLCSEKISQAKTEFGPTVDSKKSSRSLAVAVKGMFETFTVGLSSTAMADDRRERAREYQSTRILAVRVFGGAAVKRKVRGIILNYLLSVKRHT